jgi:ABC-type microcin C transport system permease subunit YejB
MFLDTDVPGAPSANDFVMRADGSVLNIDSADALVGFKPGGPIDRMFAQSSGGGGVVVENINISVAGGDAPEEMASRLAASIRPALIAELERMAIEVG